MRILLRCILIACIACPEMSLADESNSELLVQLQTVLDIDENSFKKLSGDASVFELDVPDSSREIALVGLIRLENSGDILLEDLLQSRLGTVAGPAQEEGFFTDPATAANLANLVLPSGDFEVLEKCRPNDCKFKLNLEGIKKAESLDWKSDQARSQFTDYFRKDLARYVQRFRQQGGDGLIVYNDKPVSFPLSRGADSIRQQMKLLQNQEPELFRYLSQYPNGRPPGATDRFYWSLKDLGYRPTLSVEHVIITSVPQTPGAGAVFILATIYADHYLGARYQTGFLLKGEETVGVPGQFLLVVDRMLFDDSLGRFKRSLLGRGMKSDMKDRMKFMADRAN